MTKSYDEEFPDFKSLIRKKLVWNKKRLVKRVPILGWGPNYKKKFLFNDILAGITVALTAIPQGIAYAVLAGLPPQYGLYAEMMPGIVYMFFGSCYYITIGPTAITSLLINPYVALSPDFALLGAFLVGIIVIMFGLLNLGFLVEFISIPVTTGFVTAAALTIASSQVKNLFGIPGSSNQFVDAWENIFKNAAGFNKWDTILGLSTIAVLVILTYVTSIKRWPTFFKYLSLSRNALVVFVGTLLAFLLSENLAELPIAITGDVSSSFPTVKVPPLSTEVNGEHYTFLDMVSEFGASLITIPIIATLEIFAVAKAFAKGNTIDATQEMFTGGLCNLLGSFFGGMVVTGSFTRTALNHATGVKTPFGGLFTVILVVSALGLLTDAFYFIPKATLAGVIICAVLSMIEYGMIPKLWRTKRIDLIPYFVTLLASLLLGIDYGILIGIGTNLLFILYNSARPNITCELKTIGERNVLLITPGQSLYFSAAEYLKYKVKKAVARYDTSTILIINGFFINTMDATSVASLKSLVKIMEELNKKVILWNWNSQPIGLIMRDCPELEKILMESDTIEELFSSIHLVP